MLELMHCAQHKRHHRRPFTKFIVDQQVQHCGKKRRGDQYGGGEYQHCNAGHARLVQRQRRTWQGCLGNNALGVKIHDWEQID
jgi:hypothetical protein